MRETVQVERERERREERERERRRERERERERQTEREERESEGDLLRECLFRFIFHASLIIHFAPFALLLIQGAHTSSSLYHFRNR